MSVYSDIEKEEMVRVYYCEANGRIEEAVEIYKKSSIKELHSFGIIYSNIPNRKTIFEAVCNYDVSGPLNRIQQMDQKKLVSVLEFRKKLCPILVKKIQQYFKENPAKCSWDAAVHFDINLGIINKIVEIYPECSPLHPNNLHPFGCQQNTLDAKESLPLVCTTRLEDMPILKQSRDIIANNYNLLEYIETASKPKFDMSRISRKRQHPAYHQFFLLKKKLRSDFPKNDTPLAANNTNMQQPVEPILFHANGNSKLDNFNENITQQKCIKHNKYEVVIELSDSEDNTDELDTRNELQMKSLSIMEENSEKRIINDNTGLRKYTNANYFTNVSHKESSYSVSCRLKDDKSVDVYYNNSKPTMLYFYDKNNEEASLKSTFPSKPKQNLGKCCWFNLDFEVKAISIDKFLNYPHNCPQNSCQCCCRGKLQSSFDSKCDDSENVINAERKFEVYKYLTEIDDMHLRLVPKRLTSNFITKALSKQNLMTITNKNKYSLLQRYKIRSRSRCKNTTLYFRDAKNGPLECYSTGESGKVVSYLNAGMGAEFFFPRKSILSSFWQKPYKRYSFQICCWNRRNWKLFEFVDKYSPAAVKFMNRHHPCPVGSCSCCCPEFVIKKIKNRYRIKNIVLKNIVLDLTHLSRNRDIVTTPVIDAQSLGNQVTVIVSDEEDVTESNSSKIVCNTKPFIKLNTELKSDDHSTLKTSNHSCSTTFDSSPTTFNVKDNDLIKQSSSLVNDDGKICKFTDNIAFQLVNAVSETPEAWPDQESIIDTFKDIVLSLDSNKKVLASFGKPISVLSIAELQVLINLLTKAQIAVNESYLPIPTVGYLQNSINPRNHKEQNIGKVNKNQQHNKGAVRRSGCFINNSENIMENVIKRQLESPISTASVISNGVSSKSNQTIKSLSQTKDSAAEYSRSIKSKPKGTSRSKRKIKKQLSKKTKDTASEIPSYSTFIPNNSNLQPASNFESVTKFTPTELTGIDTPYTMNSQDAQMDVEENSDVKDENGYQEDMEIKLEVEVEEECIMRVH